MKKLFYFLFAIASLSSCMSDFDQTIEYRIDPEFNSFVESFFKEAKERNISLEKNNLIVSFDDTRTTPFEPAQSLNIGFQHNVFVHKYIWDHSNDIEKKIIIYHELGHALLFKKHCNNKNALMYYAPNYGYFKDHESDSLNELFYGS